MELDTSIHPVNHKKASCWDAPTTSASFSSCEANTDLWPLASKPDLSRL